MLRVFLGFLVAFEMHVKSFIAKMSTSFYTELNPSWAYASKLLRHYTLFLNSKNEMHLNRIFSNLNTIAFTLSTFALARRHFWIQGHCGLRFVVFYIDIVMQWKHCMVLHKEISFSMHINTYTIRNNGLIFADVTFLFSACGGINQYVYCNWST